MEKAEEIRRKQSDGQLRAKGLPTGPERRRRRAKRSIDGRWAKLGDDPDSID